MFLARPNVVNKNIVYSDTVLSLKEIGRNLFICSINNVSEESLDRCLKIIFESNPDVVFNTIQYSKNNNTIYFYTDKVISTKEYVNSKYIKYEKINNSEDIVNYVEKVLNSEKFKDSNYISIYDISILLKKYKDSYNRIFKKYQDIFDNILESEYADSSIVVYDFDYKTNCLKIGFKFWSDDYDNIIFKMKDNDLYIVKSEIGDSNKILQLIGRELSNLYYEFLYYRGFMCDFCYEIKSNSMFLVNISSFGVDVNFNNFTLSSHTYRQDYDYTGNSYLILSSFNGREDDIFKKIFVKIDDCPMWCRNILSEIRKDQLDKENKIENRKQKLLGIKRKLIPWL